MSVVEAGSCSRCGALVAVVVSETVVGDRLAWAVSVRCGACGDASEDDGWDELPDDVREAVVARDGLVNLRVADGDRRLPILAVFRRGGASMAEATAAFEALTRAGVVGTPGEMRLLANRLATAGATVSWSGHRDGSSAP